MSLSTLLWSLRPAVVERIRPLAEPWPAYTLFLSLSDGTSRARVIHGSGDDFDAVWARLARQAQALVAKEKLRVDKLRADWVTGAQRLDLKTFRKLLASFKRNYFRCGLALDDQFRVAFLEQELNANAMLYGGTSIQHAVLNEKNFRHYARKRFPGHELDFSDSASLAILRTEGVFCSPAEGALPLYGTGRDAGRRVIEALDEPVVRGLIERGSQFLASQVKSDGRFLYGWHPCFDRPIRTYNTLRHASTIYAMLEAWEITRDSRLLVAIRRALKTLVTKMIASVTLPDGERAAFLVDLGDEIKLGGNAVCLLALSLYTELFDDQRYLPVMERLAVGICHMQDPVSGRFNHVLNHPDLSVKEAFRIIYYDGEAVFGLLRFYRVNRNPRWLAAVERAFDHFIGQEHWKAHDHWLAYSVNELTRYRPEERYFRFGILNVAGYLDFVEERITTFPTLLELMMAAREMLERIAAQPEWRHLLEEIDTEHFQRALEARARYLMNGHFWPEYAMYFHNPRRIEGSFFIRHHAFRVRIDDVEHYLSGYAAYYRYLKRNGADRALAASPSGL